MVTFSTSIVRLVRQWMLTALPVFLFFCALTTTTTVYAAIDPGEDFSGYIQELEAREREDEFYQAKLDEHEEWRQNTWAGAAVRKIQQFGRHLIPFFEAVTDAVDETTSSGEKTPIQVFVYLGMYLAAVIGFLTIIYIIAQVIQLVLGKDYEIIEEVVIIHEHDTEEEAAKARAATTRGKKQKNKKAKSS